MNAITLTGNVSQAVQYDPAKSYARFSIGLNGWDGEKSIPQGFADVTVFGAQAQNVALSLRVGDRVVVTGRWDATPFEKNGETVYPKARVIASEIGASLMFSAQVKTALAPANVPTPETTPAPETEEVTPT